MICPICKTEYKTVEDKFRPFCSRRCQLIDLGNWLGERYTVPGESVEPHQNQTAASPEFDESEKRPQN